eukprot:7247-Heterococcus_DN1.PRE.2
MSSAENESVRNHRCALMQAHAAQPVAASKRANVCTAVNSQGIKKHRTKGTCKSYAITAAAAAVEA